MSKTSNHLVGLLPSPSYSATTIGGVALFAGVFLLFMGFKEFSGGSSKDVDSGVRKIGLGMLATFVGAGIAATHQALSPNDEHAS